MTYLPNLSFWTVLVLSSGLSGFSSGLLGVGAGIALIVVWRVAENIFGVDLGDGDLAESSRRLLAFSSILSLCQYPFSIYEMTRAAEKNYRLDIIVYTFIGVNGLTWLGSHFATSLNQESLLIILGGALMAIAAWQFVHQSLLNRKVDDEIVKKRQIESLLSHLESQTVQQNGIRVKYDDYTHHFVQSHSFLPEINTVDPKLNQANNIDESTTAAPAAAGTVGAITIGYFPSQQAERLHHLQNDSYKVNINNNDDSNMNKSHDVKNKSSKNDKKLHNLESDEKYNHNDNGIDSDDEKDTLFSKKNQTTSFLPSNSVLSEQYNHNDEINDTSTTSNHTSLSHHDDTQIVEKKNPPPQTLKEVFANILVDWRSSTFGFFVGCISGLIGGLWGINSPPLTIYFTYLGLNGSAIRDTCLFIYGINLPCLILSRIIFHIYRLDEWLIYLVVGPITLAGLKLGMMLHDSISNQQRVILTSIQFMIYLSAIPLVKPWPIFRQLTPQSITFCVIFLASFVLLGVYIFWRKKRNVKIVEDITSDYHYELDALLANGISVIQTTNIAPISEPKQDDKGQYIAFNDNHNNNDNNNNDGSDINQLGYYGGITTQTQSSRSGVGGVGGGATRNIELTTTTAMTPQNIHTNRPVATIIQVPSLLTPQITTMKQNDGIPHVVSFLLAPSQQQQQIDKRIDSNNNNTPLNKTPISTKIKNNLVYVEFDPNNHHHHQSSGEELTNDDWVDQNNNEKPYPFKTPSKLNQISQNSTLSASQYTNNPVSVYQLPALVSDKSCLEQLQLAGHIPLLQQRNTNQPILLHDTSSLTMNDITPITTSDLQHSISMVLTMSASKLQTLSQPSPRSGNLASQQRLQHYSVLPIPTPTVNNNNNSNNSNNNNGPFFSPQNSSFTGQFTPTSASLNNNSSHNNGTKQHNSPNLFLNENNKKNSNQKTLFHTQQQQPTQFTENTLTSRQSNNKSGRLRSANSNNNNNNNNSRGDDSANSSGNNMMNLSVNLPSADEFKLDNDSQTILAPSPNSIHQLSTQQPIQNAPAPILQHINSQTKSSQTELHPDNNDLFLNRDVSLQLPSSTSTSTPTGLPKLPSPVISDAIGEIENRIPHQSTSIPSPTSSTNSSLQADSFPTPLQSPPTISITSSLSSISNTPISTTQLLSINSHDHHNHGNNSSNSLGYNSPNDCFRKSENSHNANANTNTSLTKHVSTTPLSSILTPASVPHDERSPLHVCFDEYNKGNEYGQVVNHSFAFSEQSQQNGGQNGQTVIIDNIETIIVPERQDSPDNRDSVHEHSNTMATISEHSINGD
jgi:uncharacterized membrane protein YfcA